MMMMSSAGARARQDGPARPCPRSKSWQVPWTAGVSECCCAPTVDSSCFFLFLLVTRMSMTQQLSKCRFIRASMCRTVVIRPGRGAGRRRKGKEPPDWASQTPGPHTTRAVPAYGPFLFMLHGPSYCLTDSFLRFHSEQ
jgi:hypothetical protein